MFVCYLDDSDAVESSVAVLAGYVRKLERWREYEEHAQAVYDGYGITELHTVDLHTNKRQFKDWSLRRKRNFINDLMIKSSPGDLLGLAVAIRKKRYNEKKRYIRGYDNSSALSSCFSHVVNRLVFVEHPKKAEIMEQGLSFVVEAGHRNNGSIENKFYQFQSNSRFSALKSIAFVGKEHSKAIQLADLNAYYSRRLAARMDVLHNPTSEDWAKKMDSLHKVFAKKCSWEMGIVQEPFARSVSIEDYEAGLAGINEGWHQHRLPDDLGI